ncbi:hypothetical protein Btru_064251 [Bulinus truncatus]|nr:hypothetical protein Btru_064251 [Bulinus truncatus]
MNRTKMELGITETPGLEAPLPQRVRPFGAQRLHSPGPRRSPRRADLDAENIEVGFMFASKAIMQLIANPFIGPITNSRYRVICSSVAGMGMIATYYPDDKERGNAMGIALGGLALGFWLVPRLAVFCMSLQAKEAPFLILAGLAFGWMPAAIGSSAVSQTQV